MSSTRLPRPAPSRPVRRPGILLPRRARPSRPHSTLLAQHRRFHPVLGETWRPASTPRVLLARHATIHRAICRVHRADEPVDVLTVTRAHPVRRAHQGRRGRVPEHLHCTRFASAQTAPSTEISIRAKAPPPHRDRRSSTGSSSTPTARKATKATFALVERER